MQKIIFAYLFIVVFATCCTGCVSKPSIGGSEYIGQLRSELEQLRSDYSQLQQDYQRLVDDQKFYADYYRVATEAIGSGLRELQAEGTAMGNEIKKLREYNTILRRIIQSLADAEHRAGNKDN